MTDFVPSPEMVEAGARAAYEAQSPIGRKWDDEAEVYRRQWRKHSRAVLVAACTATVTDCERCENEGHDVGEPPHDVVWAWLSPFLNAGMLEAAGWWSSHPVEELSLYGGDQQVFRVLPPASPGEGQ